MTYECLLDVEVAGHGPGLIVWEGSAIVCTERGNMNEIVLNLRNFINESNTSLNCSSGRKTTVLYVVGIVDGYYVSQISLIVNEEINNKTIECKYDNGTTETLIGVSTVSVTGA